MNHSPNIPQLNALFPGFTISAGIPSDLPHSAYAATQQSLGREVTIHLLSTAQSENEELRTAFQKQARLLSALNHETIPAIHQFGKTEGRLFTILGKIPACTLAELSHPIDQFHVAHLIKDICLGINHAHTSGIPHGNIQPANILFEQGSTPIITNFQTTPETNSPYIAPEIAFAASPPNHASDIYSIGVLLHHLLTGELPDQKLTPPSTHKGINPLFDTIVAKATHRNPRTRYANAQEMGADLLHLALTQSSHETSALAGIINIPESRATHTPTPVRVAYPKSFSLAASNTQKSSIKHLRLASIAASIAVVASLVFFSTRPQSNAAQTTQSRPQNLTTQTENAFQAAGDLPSEIAKNHITDTTIDTEDSIFKEEDPTLALNSYNLLKNLRKNVIAEALKDIQNEDRQLLKHIKSHVVAKEAIPSTEIPELIEKQKSIDAQYTNFTETWKQLYIQTCEEKIRQLDPEVDNDIILNLHAEIEKTRNELSRLASIDPER